MAAIERPRVVALKQPTNNGVHRGGGGTRKSIEPNVSAHQRLLEFPGQGYKVNGTSLYCPCCKQVLSKIKSSIVSHGASVKHMENFEKFREANASDAELKVFLVDYYTDHSDHSGADVDPAVKVERYRVVEGMMDAGVPLGVLDRLRPLLERGGISLTHSSHLRMFIPIIEKQELDRVIDEIGELPWSLTVDATRRQGEALAGVARFCDKEWVIRHRMVLFDTTEKNVNGRELATIVTAKALTKLKKASDSLMLFERDACAVNHPAFQILLVTFSATDDMLCFCHLGSLVSVAIVFVELKTFMTAWLTLVLNVAAAKALWLSMTGRPMVGYSTIRWHS
jgi:hypothetical protein